jgi:hypothetical protein
MSRFDDYDEFLKTQASNQKNLQEELKEKIIKSRTQLDPWIEGIFSLLKEYIETILMPRRGFLMILKKRESLDKIETKTNANPYFVYRINLIPKELLPGAFDPTDVIGENHFTPNHVTENDWHFDVSMQFDLLLFDTYDEMNHSLTGNLEPRFFLRTWGKLTTEQSMLMNPHISISYPKAWKQIYTEIEIRGNNQELPRSLEDTLMILTPRVLAHLEEVWKIKK